jgi:hypothetical protein
MFRCPKVTEMKDEKVYMKRELNEEGIKEIPNAVEGGLKDLDKDARDDAKVIDKEDKRLNKKTIRI